MIATHARPLEISGYIKHYKIFSKAQDNSGYLIFSNFWLTQNS